MKELIIEETAPPPPSIPAITYPILAEAIFNAQINKKLIVLFTSSSCGIVIQEEHTICKPWGAIENLVSVHNEKEWRIMKDTTLTLKF